MFTATWPWRCSPALLPSILRWPTCFTSAPMSGSCDPTVNPELMESALGDPGQDNSPFSITGRDGNSRLTGVGRPIAGRGCGTAVRLLLVVGVLMYVSIKNCVDSQS